MGNFTRLTHDLISTPGGPRLEDFMVDGSRSKNILITGAGTPNARLRRAGMAPVGEQIAVALIEGDDAGARDILEYYKSVEKI